jgi:hypothetical protein
MLAPITQRRSFRASLVLSWLAVGLAACAGQGDVDRTQPDAIDKSIFLEADGTTPRKFYYRKTTVAVPPTSSYSFDGLMGDMYKVRFEFSGDGNLLMGYRAFDYAPGSTNPTNGGENNKDTPFLIFKVSSHFDIKREYNPATGEETNVISENSTDRPWSDRKFMRVDWSKNLAEGTAAQMALDPLYWFLPGAQTIGTGYYVGEGDEPLLNPDRPIVRNDYIDFVTKEMRTPEYSACLRLFDTFDDGSPWGCGPAEIAYRNSLLPVPPSEYEPLSYPDRQILRDAAGKPLRMAFTDQATIPCTPKALADNGLTGDDCTEASLDQFAKFGYFRTVRPTYDRQVGATEEGRQYYINRWNIWKETIKKDGDGKPFLDANGNPHRIEPGQRQTRTITFYLNPEFPAEPLLRKEAQNVIDDWDMSMRETVAGIRLSSTGQAPDLVAVKTMAKTLPRIFDLKENSCSMMNVTKFVTDNPDVRAQVEKRDTGHVLDFDALEPSKLLKACTALEVVTEARPSDDPKKFTWQRNGDLRYSFMHWVDRPQVQGPLGYGPSSPDPETGEIISATAFIYGAALDTYAKFALDSVRLANGQLDPDDLLSGKTISDVIADTARTSQQRQGQQMTDAARAMVKARTKGLGQTREQRLIKVGAGIDDQPLAALKGTNAEKLLFNDDVLPAIIRGYRPGDVPPANVLDQAMTKPWLSKQASEARRSRFQTFANHGCVYMAEFADDAILGLALELDGNIPQSELFNRLRALIFRGLAGHEVGHTVGLRHNFSSSTDALNFSDEYWRVREMYPAQTWEREHKLTEFAYASVMDYGARFNSDVHGLGKYDTAAIRFGYGQLIDLIPDSAESAFTGLRNDILLWDYTNLPCFAKGTIDGWDAQGRCVNGDRNRFSEAATLLLPYKDFVDLWTDEFRNLDQNGGSVVVFPEKPYKFCGDEYEGNYDCKTWDLGANQREIIANVTNQFRNYYVFNAYKRGRTTWEIDNYLIRLEERYFNRYSQAFQFFFFYSDWIDVDFGADLFLASIDSLNALAAILQTPEPGLHCPTSYSPNVATFPVNEDGQLDRTVCLPGSTPVALTLPDAKPFYIDFSDDYYYRITRAGSLYEKLEALLAITSTESRFFRIDDFADQAARFSINYYRFFRDEVVKLLSGVIRNDPALYAATFDAENRLVPTPVVDLNVWGDVDAPTPPYMLPNAVHVATPVNKTVRYWALLLSLARLGSTWDTTLDFHNFLAIGIKGGDDDFQLAPGTPVAEYAHPETGVIYRAPANTAGARVNIGKEIVDELNVITGTAGATGTIPVAYGSYTDGTPLPNWYTAKKAMDDALAGGNQEVYSNALSTFNYIKQLLAYRVDLVSDIRLIRKQLLVP